MSSNPHRELTRLAGGDGPTARAAETALGSGSDVTRLRAAILALADARGPRSSICPSDAARAVGGNEWRDLNDKSRCTALELAREGTVEITQRGDVVDPRQPVRGPIRIRVVPD